MTNEELINHIKYDLEIGADITLTNEDAEKIIKALEQEPILDKIRAEIDAHREKLKIMADDDWYAGKIRGYDCAIEIIDKYTAEGSRKE